MELKIDLKSSNQSFFKLQASPLQQIRLDTMAKDRTLKAALDRQKGVHKKLERQKQIQKRAEKIKRKQKEQAEVAALDQDAVRAKEERRRSLAEEQLAREKEAADKAEAIEAANGAEVGGWQTDLSEAAEEVKENGGVDLEAIDDDSDSNSSDKEIPNGDAVDLALPNGDVVDEDEVEVDEEIPLSDIASLESEERGDVIPHQRLTINNVPALQRSLRSFALPSSLPFSATQSVTSAEPVQIADVEDDLSRELAFYKQSLDAVKEARAKLKKEGVLFSRPADYFAEMVKSEEQMGKVRKKMVDEAARKKASADARRQRDLKKFGKAVQVAKLQERDKAKRQTLDKINALKRSMCTLLPDLQYDTDKFKNAKAPI